MPELRAGVVAAALVAACGTVWGQGTPQNVFWNNPDGGAWSDSANWSPDVVPNNAGQSLFNATLDLQDVPYQVLLDIDVTLENFSLLWSGATLDLGLRNFTVNNDLRVRRGMLTRGEGEPGDLSVGGVLTLDDAALMAAGTIRTNGAISLEGKGTIDICNTSVDHRGAGGINWDSPARLNIDMKGSLRNGEDSSFTITGSEDREVTGDGTGLLINDGNLVQGPATRGQAGITTINNVIFQNNGTVSVEGGGLILNTINSLTVDDTLVQGVWNIRNNSFLDFGDSTFSRLATEVNISGGNSFFNAIQNLREVTEQGSFSISDQQNFFAQDFFINSGRVEVGRDSIFDTSVFGLGNIDGDAIFGGTFVVEGEFRTGAARIEFLASDLTLVGLGASFDGIHALNEIGSGGRFALEGRRGFQTIGDLAVAESGAVRVGAESILAISGNLLSVNPDGVLTSGSYDIAGTLSAQNLRLTVLSSELFLRGDGSRLLDGNGRDALESLRRISQTGALLLREGRSLDIDGNFVVENLLSIEGAFDSGSRATVSPGTFRVAGNLLFTETSTLEFIINGTTPDLYGQVFAVSTKVDPGATLSLMLGLDTTVSLGDTFALLQTGSLSGMFTNFLGLDLGGGLFFEIEQNQNGVFARVVPAPASGLLVVLGLAAARRRR